MWRDDKRVVLLVGGLAGAVVFGVTALYGQVMWRQSFLSDYQIRETIDMRRGWAVEAGEGWAAKFWHNKVTYIGKEAAARWVGAFSWERLASPINSETGRQLPLITWAEIGFGVVGLAVLFKKSKWLIFGLVTAVLPYVCFSISYESGAVVLGLIWVGGVVVGMSWVKEKAGWWWKAGFWGSLVFVVWGVVIIFNMMGRVELWQDGRALAYEALAREIIGIKGSVVVTDRLGQPHLAVLFYGAYPPEKYRNERQLGREDRFGLPSVLGFGTWSFRSINWREELGKTEVVVGFAEELDRSEILAGMESEGKLRFLGEVSLVGRKDYLGEGVNAFGDRLYVVKISPQVIQ